MEGYFVRTLGMHRVYNSAFMHMMMKEENEKYKYLIKNTLEFNPEILKRYVNFMSNPDEETAVNQFGKGDKYFGVAVLMVTFPGLPMFAHGQIEGFSEKYGMEYKRSYYDEFIDDNLVNRHEYEIFPLMSKRHLFSQVENFELFDFIDDRGNVNHNVFAFSNSSGNERALIIYNNSYSQAAGTIKFSSPKISAGSISSRSLADALNIKSDYPFFYIYQDHRTRLEYLFTGRELHDYGFYISLQGYEYRACINFKEIYDTTGIYQNLNNSLRGRGVNSVEQEVIEFRLAPVHNSLNNLFNPDTIISLRNYCFPKIESLKVEDRTNDKSVVDIETRVNDLTKGIKQVNGVTIDGKELLEKLKKDFKACKSFSTFWQSKSSQKTKSKLLEEISTNLAVFNETNSRQERFQLIFIFIVKQIEGLSHDHFFEKYLIAKPLRPAMEKLNFDYEMINERLQLIKIISSKEFAFNKNRGKLKTINKNDTMSQVFSILQNAEVQSFLNINQFEGTTFISKERLETLLDWLFTVKIIEKTGELDAVSSKSTARTKSNKIIKKTGSQKKSNTDKLLLDSMKADFKIFEKVKQIASAEGYKLFNIQSEINDFQSKIVKNTANERKGVKKKPPKKPTSSNKRRSQN